MANDVANATHINLAKLSTLKGGGSGLGGGRSGRCTTGALGDGRQVGGVQAGDAAVRADLETSQGRHTVGIHQLGVGGGSATGDVAGSCFAGEAGLTSQAADATDLNVAKAGAVDRAGVGICISHTSGGGGISLEIQARQTLDRGV